MDSKTRAATDLDLAEYDQMDEFRQLMMDNENQIYCDNSKLLVTLSSGSDGQTSADEANCENDFVFLPSPLVQPPATRSQAAPTESAKAVAQQQQAAKSDTAPERAVKVIVQQPAPLPLLSLNNNGNNPFGKYQPHEGISEATVAAAAGTTGEPFLLQRPPAARRGVIENYLSKPFGLIEVCQTLGNNANKLADLMQQIVTRSDLINIAIPCAYCHESIACPPSDISGWVNHMSRQHNCKVCPVCSKMVGLGPDKDINVMRKHVVEHLDSDWLERRANRISFTFGLQQQWFSGGRCVVRDQTYR